MSDSNMEEEQETLIYMNFDSKMDDDFFSTDKEIKIIGLDEEKPILQLGNQVFRGEWRDTMGTHIFLEESENVPPYDPIFSEAPEIQMQYTCKTDKVLHISRIFLNPSNDNSETIDNDVVDRNELLPS